MSRAGGRPRLELDELAVTWAYELGVTENQLAQAHGVDRYVVRRVLRDHGIRRREHKRYTPPTKKGTP